MLTNIVPFFAILTAIGSLIGVVADTEAIVVRALGEYDLSDLSV